MNFPYQKYMGGGLSIIAACEKVGIPLPIDCRDVKILIPVDGPMCLQFECLISEELGLKIAKAFELIAKGEV